MYYFRDCYFDQRLAYGVAGASLSRSHRKRKRRAVHGPSQGSALDYVTPFVYIGLTFGTGFMVLDVLGLEHLAQAPPLDGVVAYAEYIGRLAADAFETLPVFRAG